MARWITWSFAAAALAMAPAAQADDKETKRESAATSQSGTTQQSDDPARGDTARGAMNQTESSAKQTPPDSSTPRSHGNEGTAGTGSSGATGAAASTSAAAGSGDADARKQHDASVPSRHDNTDLIKKLWSSNVLEIEAAKVAKDDAQSERVKEFAERMENDHGKMRDALADLADKRNLKLEQDEALSAHKAHLEQMEDMKGAKLDRHYTSMMVKHHAQSKKDVDAALKRAQQSGDHELAAVLQSAKSTIAEHHRLAQSLDKGKGQQRMGRRGSDPGASAERTGERMERGAERTGEKIERGAERTGDAVERGAERTGEAARDATR